MRIVRGEMFGEPRGNKRELSPENLENLRKIMEKDLAEITAAFRRAKNLTPEQSEEIIELRPEWEIVEKEWQAIMPSIPEMKDPEKKKAIMSRFEDKVREIDSGLKI